MESSTVIANARFYYGFIREQNRMLTPTPIQTPK